MASPPPPPPPPCHCCCCACPCVDQVIILRVPFRPSVFAPDRPPWMSQLAEADFSKACVADRVCSTCDGAAFCEHCCGNHHRGHGTSPAADGDHAVAATHRRDSFCIGCRVAFCSELCAHHNDAVGGEGERHEVIHIDDYDCWYCARCTGSERWFLAAFDGVQTFGDKHGNCLVPLHSKRAAVPDAECRSWASALLAADFEKMCVTDRVCNTCSGAGFCEHCCGEHHRGHDTTAATAKDKEPPAVHRRDSFCIGCRVAFCSDLCAHHDAVGGGIESHEVIPIDDYNDSHCARCTGSERWFHAIFDGVQTFKDKHGNLLVPLRRKSTAAPKPGCGKVEDGQGCPPWMYQLVAANFSKTCARDSVCNTCDGAAFCEHCCGEHHQGHDTAPATAKETDGSAPSEGHRRDSFCTGCGVDFCSELCAHHAGHEVMPIDVYGDRHFVRSTASEPWFTPSAFGGIETFEDKDGNLMVPLEQKRSWLPEPGLSYTCTRRPLRPHGEPTRPPAAANPF